MTSQVFSADSSDFQDAALAPAFSPLYQQIKGLILQGLQSGEWKPGEGIPSEMELAARYRNDFFNVAFPTLNLGCIHGGDSPNRICGQAELHFDLRMTPAASARNSIKQSLAMIAKRQSNGDYLLKNTGSLKTIGLM